MSLFADLPLSCLLDVNRRRRMSTLLDLWENQMDRRIGHAVRRMPSILQDLEDEFEGGDNGRKRKRKTDAVSLYEPKTKAQVVAKDGKFQVQLDTSNYQPDEITVKIVNDKLSITAKHETNSEGVYEFHEMARTFDLPEGVEPEAVTSRLSPGGQLTVEAPMKAAKEAVNERVVPIKRTEEPQPVESAENDKDSQTSGSDSKTHSL
ncbi:SHSP domain-containing protein [Caerostris darwini]|uniref:SHSP domain-containing protein n=1 Tax=Caerostris darwini TaxID=1538125 RepID=A0AAV4UKA3_9ARAC|nr:SHSP domain-containing protein [Caerostris darwini]